VATGWLPGRLSAAEIAFAGTGLPILWDWRLRECDYGELNGAPVETVHARRAESIDLPYPGGESWRQAVGRNARLLDDLALRWSGTRVLIIGHVATRWALQTTLAGVPLEALVAQEFEWQEGWEFRIPRT
jgi:alpha-ribazole phosphatase/probable phosphoglycerate mutase